jgi:hypothetical protein
MGIPTTGPIRMGGAGTNSIAQVKAGTDTGTPSAVQNVSLRGLSVDGVNDFQYIGGASVDIAVAGSSPDQTAPHRMSEFYGYVQSLQTVSNVQNYTGNTAAEFVRVTSGSGGFVLGLIEYQLVVRTTTSGSNYVATLYVEETNNGLGSYNNSGMTTGTLYPVQTVTFTQGNWPDSYALDHSVAVTSSGGAVQAGTSLVTGSGETYTFTANWDNTTFELLNPTSSTAGKVGHLTTGECFNGTVIYLDTFIWKFIKSGYPTLTAATFNINNEQDMAHFGICP